MRRAALGAAVAAWAAAAAEAAGYAPLPLENGAYGAVELTPHVWTAGACSRDAWVDFYVEVDASSAASNLFFEVVLDAPDGMAAVVPDALELAVFVGAVDESRATELRSESTQDRALSFAINSQEVGAGRYYASVRCAPHSDGYGFGVLVERIPEALDAGGAAADGAICGDELLFHSYDAAALASDESLRFEVCLPAGSAAAVKLMAKVGHPPLRVAAPAVSLDGGGCRTFDVCRDELDGGLAYLALYGEGACTAYNASAAPFAGACDLELGDLDGGAYRDAAADLALERVAYASCEPYGWRDFRVPLEPADLATNLLFEVLDVTGATSRGTNPEALSVHVFRDEIPEDRVTQNRAERSASATYAVFKSFVSLLAMRNATALYVSVRCGHEPARFRLFGERVTAALAPDRVVRGEVCPGNFIYHYVDVPGDAAAAGKVNVAFEVLAFEGSVVFSAAGEPPLRVTPPYASTAGVAPATVTLCYHAVGSPAYVAVSAEGGACATYDVVARWSAASADACELQDPYDGGLRAAALDIHVPLDDACAPRQYQFYSVDVDAARAHDNLLLEVTRADEALDGETPDALSVFVYAGEIPADFASELRADRGVEGAWAVSVAATDLREGTYYVGVRCDALAVRYAVVALLIPAGIAAGAISHGELCPENWVYHALAPLQAAPAGPGGRRALATAAGANATHVRFTIWRLSGDFNAVARHGFPVVYLTPPYSASSDGSVFRVNFA